MANYNSIQIGDKAVITHTITEDDIRQFVALTGDDNKIHIDNEFAGKTSFKKPVAHGMLSAAFISTIIGTKIPGDGALWFSQTLDFLLPVRVGDVITVKAEVISKIESLHAIELQTDIYNQNHQKVIAGKAKIKIVEEEIQTKERAQAETSLKKRIALVLGATGGIGAEICRRLALDGFDIAIHYNSNKEKSAEIETQVSAIGRKAFAVKADITSREEVDDMVLRTIRRLGGISLVVNCATAKLSSIKLADLGWDEMVKQFDINIKASFNIVKAVVPHMKENKDGRIIFITSQATENVPPPDWYGYVTAKYALNGFAKSLAVELAASNIAVNLVSPGMTETDLISDIPEKARMLVAAKTPLKRLASPKDIAGVIGFLASDDANYITGETIRVNGGQNML
ncbi:MAG: SDR family oxidoreductase [Chitinophagaceae bacterium]|nr:SDR family oxidoreductase [Chitinophagaceae bacterium]